VLGVGDEEYAVQQGMTNAERDKVCLPKDDKIAHLKALVK
jgi:hypothetical protein